MWYRLAGPVCYFLELPLKILFHATVLLSGWLAFIYAPYFWSVMLAIPFIYAALGFFMVTGLLWDIRRTPNGDESGMIALLPIFLVYIFLAEFSALIGGLLGLS